MTSEHSDDQWTLTAERLPDHANYGAYPTVDVILQLDEGFGSIGTPALRRHADAQLRYIGNDVTRPYWTDENGNTIENTSWRVVYWRRVPEFPDPAPKARQPNYARAELEDSRHD